MTPSSPGRIGHVSLALLLIAGCSGSSDRPSAVAPVPAVPSSTSLASASTPPRTVPPTEAAALAPDPACEVDVPPSLDDAPSQGGGDLIDRTDYGPGRWRSCLIAPEALTFEGTAHCGWDEARTSITEVLGLPTPVAEVDIDGYVAFERSEAGYSITYEDGRVVGYSSPRAPTSIETGPDRLAGQIAFDLAQYVDPELGVVVDAPAVVAGTLAWVCGDPPAPG
jgi:hypothetical protein